MILRVSGRFWKLGLVSFLAIASAGDCVLAQIKTDGTLRAESSVVTSKVINGIPTDQIDGGAIRGANLFHSFEQFSVLTGQAAYFNNSPAIQNIISRVTGGSVSNIDGLIRANPTSNLFLINPNGFIFGPNASLNIGGSFLASTASSINFADSLQFSAKSPQTTPLLTVSVPIGLQFGANPGTIRNQSQASPGGATNSFDLSVGLKVQLSKTLALVGGDVMLEGGNLTAAGGPTAVGGRIELGSVAGNSLVSLNPTEKGWALGYEGVQNFQNIQLTQRTFNGSEIPSVIDASGYGGGDIQVRGRKVMIAGGSGILTQTLGSQPGGNLTVTGSESVELIGPSTLTTQTQGAGKGGDLTINTGQLILSNGAQALTSTSGENGLAGQLTVNALDSVELTGGSPDGSAFSSLSSSTFGAGAAGNITINTGRLLIRDGANITTASLARGGVGGRSTLSTGPGGELTINASDSVELTNGSSVDTMTAGSGSAGNLTINTGKLLIQNQSEVAVSSARTGMAGNLEVRARSISLDTGGTLNAENSLTQGGNIKLQQVQDLRLRHNSKISTNAGGSGNGGNITINTDTLVGLEGSTISANANVGQGGNVNITTQGLFLSPDSKITATSERGPQFDGLVEINTLGINPTIGLVNLPVQPVDVSGLIAQGCPADVGPRASKFVITGRGGLPPTPREALRNEPALADLGTSVQSQENQPSAAISTKTTSYDAAPIVEATGWVTNAKGEVVLVAQAPTVTPNIPWLTPTTCHTP